MRCKVRGGWGGMGRVVCGGALSDAMLLLAVQRLFCNERRGADVAQLFVVSRQQPRVPRRGVDFDRLDLAALQPKIET